MESLKERREKFVSDLIGGSTADIYIVTSVSAASYFVWTFLRQRTSLFSTSNDSVGQIIDFLLNWNNLLLATTVYSHNVPLLYLLVLLPILMVLLNTQRPKLALRKVLINFKTLSINQYLPYKNYITVYRAQMMIITCICIMAVDFQLFPRRFAKVETWGTSLMDLGVGSFVFSMGLISARSYLRQFYVSKFNYTQNIVKCVKSCVPIVFLGVVRLVSVKSVDYHEHVTEYGKHWNFFFTLACMPIFSTILSPIIIKVSPLVLSMVIMCLYEYFLIELGGLAFIISAPRNSFLEANREGILSLFGYFSIFLNGLALGSAILPVIETPYGLFKLNHSKESLEKAYRGGKRYMSSTWVLFIISVIFQAVYYVLDTCYVYGVSRRTANLLYVIWVSAYNCTFLFLYNLIERYMWGAVEINVIASSDEDEKSMDDVESDVSCLSDEDHVPESLKAVNLNSLTLFICANLLTGLINLSYNTLDSSPWESLLVLVVYELILSGLCLILYKLGIIIR